MFPCEAAKLYLGVLGDPDRAKRIREETETRNAIKTQTFIERFRKKEARSNKNLCLYFLSHNFKFCHKYVPLYEVKAYFFSYGNYKKKQQQKKHTHHTL